VLLVALIVPFVRNTDTYRKKYEETQKLLEVARKDVQIHEADLNARINAHAAEIAEWENVSTQLRAQINDKDTQIQAQAARVIELQNANAAVEGRLAQLSAALKQATEINTALQDEIVDRREKMLKLQTRTIELSDQLRDMTTQRDTLVQLTRLHKETITDLEAQNQEIVEKLNELSAESKQKPETELSKIVGGIMPAHAIQGVVTDVKVIGDDTFVAVNVGLNDGVKEGMKFMIHKGDVYLGDVIVNTVDRNSAAGRVTLKAGEITPNSEVMAGGL
jgi:vacuolar-type H+-ATPase subunit I/STV1